MDDDYEQLPDDDFRRPRRYLAQHVFMAPDGVDPEEWRTGRRPSPTDLVNEEVWDDITHLTDHVALFTTSHDGSRIGRLRQLESDWVFSWPPTGEAPYMDEVVLLAGEEFTALVFNALHGWYRQALGCLRNALEGLMIAADLAVAGDSAAYQAWRGGNQLSYRRALGRLAASREGRQVDADANHHLVFGGSAPGLGSWADKLWDRLCGYAHSQAGSDNAHFWKSNGPIYVHDALAVVEADLRETLALSYLLVRLAWPTYAPRQGQSALVNGDQGSWAKYDGVLRKWLLPP
jgi:hypothetical protein